MIITPEQRAAFARDGFLHIRNFFSADEVRRFQDATKAFPANPGRPVFRSRYFYQIPGLENLWADARFLETARQLLGSEVVYFFDGNISRYDFPPGDLIQGRHLHHDAKGTVENLYNRLNVRMDQTYPAIRFISHFQNATTQSGGLKVVPGSHRMDVSNFDSGDPPSLNVQTQPGDVIVFTHRLLHSPFAMRLKAEPDRALDTLIEDRLAAARPDLFLPVPEVREILVSDYADMSELADIHMKNRAIANAEDAADLSDYLVAHHLNDDQASHTPLLRFDRAIVETVKAIRRHIVDGQEMPGIAIHLERLPKLYRANWETSSHYSLLDIDCPDESPETGRLLFNAIEEKLAEIDTQRRDISDEYHMNSRKKEQLEYFAQNYPDDLLDGDKVLREPRIPVAGKKDKNFTITADQMEEMVKLVVQNPRNFLLIEECRRYLTRDRWEKSAQNLDILGTLDDGVMPGTITHNRREIDQSNFGSSRRTLRLINPLTSIEPVYSQAAQLKVLSIGPRTEMELLHLIGVGFSPKNISAVDLISSSPMIDVGDMHDLPYADKSFDVVISGWVIAYSKRPQRAMDEMIRVCKDGGLIAIARSIDPNDRDELESEITATKILGSMQTNAQEMIDMVGPRLAQVCFQHDPIDAHSRGAVILIARIRHEKT